MQPRPYGRFHTGVTVIDSWSLRDITPMDSKAETNEIEMI